NESDSGSTHPTSCMAAAWYAAQV
ncbi:hypothetical protein CCACVL1_01054, partial [Corchorus capsularis]